MNRSLVLVIGLLAIGLALAPSAQAKVVNNNEDNLPPACDEISEELEFTVRGGTEFAKEFNGVAYTFDRHSFEVPTCARITFTFENTDDIRHQFMPHGTWPNGFTLLEVNGPGNETGTIITPGNPTTLMIHCGVNQHQQKGMKAQLVVGEGSGTIPNIPGVSGLPPEDAAKDIYFTDQGQADSTTGLSEAPGIPTIVAGLLLGAAALLKRRS